MDNKLWEEIALGISRRSLLWHVQETDERDEIQQKSSFLALLPLFPVDQRKWLRTQVHLCSFRGSERKTCTESTCLHEAAENSGSYPSLSRGRLWSGGLFCCGWICTWILRDTCHFLCGWFPQTDPETQNHSRRNHVHLEGKGQGLKRARVRRKRNYIHHGFV